MYLIINFCYFSKIARKDRHFLFNGKNVKQICDFFVCNRPKIRCINQPIMSK